MRVSIIAPVYNAEKYIERCIRSVLAQTYADWELLIVDDGSTDHTPDIIRSFDDARIHYIPLPHRGLARLAESYNTALARAGGDLIAILEGDDEWPPEKLATQVPAFDTDDVVLSWGRGMMIDESSRRIKYWPVRREFQRDIPMPELFRVLARWNVLSPAVTVMLRRSALERIGGFQMAGSSLFVDLPTWLLVAATAQGRARYVDADLGLYRTHPTNTGLLHNPKMRHEHDIVFRAIRDRLGASGLDRLGWTGEDDRRTAASASFTQGMASLQGGEWPAARTAFRRTLRGTRSASEFAKALAGYASALARVDLAGMMTRVRYGHAARWLPLLLLALPAACSDPFVVASVRAYTQVATGGEHSCALSEAGQVWCWGRGLDGELGTGNKDSRATPALVTGGLTFKAVTAGDAHTCALATDGAAWCWGWNAFFQRGNSIDGTEAAPVRVTGNRTFTHISAGAHHTCALGTDSIAYCWGYNRFGQLGNGTTNTAGEPYAVVGNVKFSGLSAGAYHTCGVTSVGSAYCWGKNDFGQLGIGTSATMSTTPAVVAGGVTFREIDGGATHTCGVATDSRFYCWGSSAYGELGDGAVFKEGLPGRFTPYPVSENFPRGVKIDAGTYHTCAFGDGGVTRCWGRGDYGQLAIGSTNDNFHPQPVSIFRERTRFTALGLGGLTHACGIIDREVYCWGTGHLGQLGVEQSFFTALPQRVAN